MTHLPKNEVVGRKLFKLGTSLAFDLFFQVGNIAIDWYDDFECGFVSIDEAPKNVLRHFRLQREREGEAWRLKDGKGEREKGEVAVPCGAAIAVNAYQQASTNKQTSSEKVKSRGFVSSSCVWFACRYLIVCGMVHFCAVPPRRIHHPFT
jgi:hypothetical protein